MSSTSSSIHYSVDNHPVINGLLKEYSSVKMANVKLASKKLAELSAGLAGIDGLDPINCGRVQFIAKSLFEEINSYSDSSEKILSALCAIANLKNAMQVEAILFGGIAPIIFKFYELSKIPYLKELLDTLPEIVSKIKYDITEDLQANEGFYRIDANLFVDYIESIGVEKMPDEFDILFFSLLYEYEWKEGNILIPMGKLPSRALLQKIIEEKGVYSKLLAQVLYLCSIDEELLFDNFTIRTSGHELMEVISEGVFRNYVTKQKLIPFFHLVLEKLEYAKSKGISCQEIFLKKDFVESFVQIVPQNWIEEAASAYQLIRKIESISRRFLPKERLNLFDFKMDKEACDPHVILYSDMMQKMRKRWSIQAPYPISREKPFCSTSEEFKVLVHTEYLKGIKIGGQSDKKDDFAPKLPKIKASPTKKKGPKKDSFPLGKEFEETHHRIMEEEEKQAPQEVQAAQAALASSAFVDNEDSFLPNLIHSLHETFSFLNTITIHPRVDAWRISKEEGLEHYHFFSASSSHHLTEEEMVKSHRFPEIFFSLIFNKNYSKKQQIEKLGQLYTHYRACVIVNGQKHILEATLDSVNTLYHFYLKPIKRLSHYFEMTMDSYAEFPPLESLRAPKAKPIQSADHDGFALDPDGHILVSYEGNDYKVLYLGQSKDPKSVILKP